MNQKHEEHRHEEHKHEEHGHNEEFKIIVNGKEKEWKEDKISYEQIIALAFHPVDPKVYYEVTYKRGPHQNPEGSLVPGQSVHVKSGEVFNVTPTNRS